LWLDNHLGLTSHPEDMLALIELVVPVQIGVCLDSGNFYDGQDNLPIRLLLTRRVAYVHFGVE
jgi:sugar phosphate isomerase/epimerase